MRNFKYFMVVLVIVLTFMLSPSLVLAEDVYASVSIEFDDAFYEDAEGFVDIIDDVSGWGILLCSHNPYSIYWEEEIYYGMDDLRADAAELTLLIAHGDPSGNVTEIVFGGYRERLDNPDTVRLGYESPDDDGINIWWVSITCQLLKTTSRTSWADCLTGTHMILSFKSNAVITNFDLREFADRLTDGGTYSQETVKNAFYHTYVDDDGTHDDNIASIIYENYSVLSNDYIDSFDDQTTVDSTKHFWIGY